MRLWRFRHNATPEVLCLANHEQAMKEKEENFNSIIEVWQTKQNELIAALKGRDKQIAALKAELEKWKACDMTTIIEILKEKINVYSRNGMEFAIKNGRQAEEIVRLREALRDIVIWAEGSTCEICGKKKMTDTDGYGYARNALRKEEMKG